MQEACYYTRDGDQIRCELCPHYCQLEEGQTGRCQVRKVKDNKLRAVTYQQVGSIAVDPIEKKPLYHFHPGTQILSLGTKGCNLSCQFCQNHQLAQGTEVPTKELTAEQVVQLAQEKDVVGIAYTYSEPLVWYEYILETAKLAQQVGLKNVLVTNGLINSAPLEELLPYINGINLDVKAFTEEFYQDICGGDLAPVKQTAEQVAGEVLLEITTLLIPDLNDSAKEIAVLTDWIAGLNPDIPLHLARYFPRYKLNKRKTPRDTMKEAEEIAEQKLNHVYLGNIPDLAPRNTYCPTCGREVVTRDYKVEVNLTEGACPQCGREINIVN